MNNNNINGTTLKEQIRKWLSNVKLEEFCAEIESKVIGQKTINRILANIHSYLYCVAYNKPINHNMLLAAPSGTGKTETYRVIKAYFKNHIPLLPVNIFDVSQVTPTGYKGEDVKNILAPYFAIGSYETVGLCFLDEFDKKLIKKSNGSDLDFNVQAQGNLLTIIEGSDFESEGIMINTTNIMFIGMGAFDYLRTVRANYYLKKYPNPEDRKQYPQADYYAGITKEHMIDCGAIYELLGRFPILINYYKLTKESIDRITDLTVSKISESYNMNITVKPTFRSDMHRLSDSKYGCRQIDSVIRGLVLDGYLLKIDKAHGREIKCILESALKAVVGFPEEFEGVTEEKKYA